MVVCKYFQQGYCRYGPSCRFEHVSSSKYYYQATAPSAPLTQSEVTDDQLVNQVQLDAQAVLRGGQWLLSCYAPFKEKQTFPGIPDLSPEEARLFIYEAQASNNFDQAVGYMNNIVEESKFKYEQLFKTTPGITKVLRSLYNGEAVSSPFVASQTTTGTTSNAASVFRDAMQKTPFGENTNPSIFGQQQSNAAKSIFAQASQNIFGSSAQPHHTSTQNFQNSTAKSLFAQANQNVFGTNSPPQNNSTSIFGSSSQPFFFPPQQQQTSPFTNSSNNVFSSLQPSIFGKTNNTFNNKEDIDLSIYSKPEDLTEEDLEQFKSDSFKLGFIPELPPPQSLCV